MYRADAFPAIPEERSGLDRAEKYCTGQRQYCPLPVRWLGLLRSSQEAARCFGSLALAVPVSYSTGGMRHAHVLIFGSIDDDEWEVKHHKPAPSP